MTGILPITVLWMLLCTMIALFYLFRLVIGRKWLSHFDAEDEVGHGIMAMGMIGMLAPVSPLPSDFLDWNIILFAFCAMWWIFRLFVRKPLLAFLLGKHGEHSAFQSDAIHVVMYVGMCFMFLLMRSMVFSMTPLAIPITRIFFISFAFLTVSYSLEISKDLRTARIDWLRLSANLAHMLMSGIMCWMFFEMVFMGMSMP